nr:hypothetical protein [Gammaproteobacteria bacterium]
MPTRKTQLAVTLTRRASLPLTVRSIDSGPAAPGLNTMSSYMGRPFCVTRRGTVDERSVSALAA